MLFYNWLLEIWLKWKDSDFFYFLHIYLPWLQNFIWKFIVILYCLILLTNSILICVLGYILQAGRWIIKGGISYSWTNNMIFCKYAL